MQKDTEGTCLVEYKFDKLEAMRHIEKVHGKKLLSFSTSTAYYTGEPRVFWQLEGEKEDWANPRPEFSCSRCLDALFFPNAEVVSKKIDVYAETFEFVVRQKGVETAKEEEN